MQDTPRSHAPSPRSSLAGIGFRALNGVVRPFVDRGFGNPLVVGVGPVVVETTGRSSGLPRSVPLLAVRLGDRVFVSTVRSRSHWYANLSADHRARVRLFGRDRPASADLVDIGPFRTAALRLSDAPAP